MRTRLLGPGDRVAVALSSGADSTALWWLLLECAPVLGYEVAGAVHLNHGLRGADADADEAWCRALAGGLGLPVHVEFASIAALAGASGRSIEHEGREARYQCFARALEVLNANRVATGHTLDDQAETVVLRLARGSGPAALQGIRRRRGDIVRPILDLRRGHLRDYLSSRGLTWREDRSNSDIRFARNRLRRMVMPALVEAFSDRALEAIARAAALAECDSEVLDALTAAARSSVVAQAGEGRTIAAAELAAQPLAVRRRLVHAALVEVAGGRFIGTVHVDLVLSAMAAPRGATRLELPGQTAVLQGGRLELRRRRVAAQGEHQAKQAGVCHFPAAGVLSIAGVRLEASGVLPVAEGWARASGLPAEQAGDWALVDADAVADGLRVRFRRPGDRLRPLGMDGHRKLQDLLVDRKLPREQRDRVPLVVDARDRIVWVAGHALSADFRVSPGTTRVLLLQVQRSGGAG
jgi:tRNA(Ile)-lysidine synthase